VAGGDGSKKEQVWRERDKGKERGGRQLELGDRVEI